MSPFLPSESSRNVARTSPIAPASVEIGTASVASTSPHRDRLPRQCRGHLTEHRAQLFARVRVDDLGAAVGGNPQLDRCPLLSDGASTALPRAGSRESTSGSNRSPRALVAPSRATSSRSRD